MTSTPAKKILSKADILGVNDVKSVEVPVPEWGGSVYVRQMTAGQRDAYETDIHELFVKLGADGVRNCARALMVAHSVVDAEGNLLFTRDDVEALSKKAANAMSRITDTTVTLNKLTEAAVEDLAKN